jgi:hypothetical protein
MLFLYPLLLQAYRGVPFQPWLHGSIDGISPRDFRALLTRRDALRPGVLRHVFLHASLERTNAESDVDVRSELAAAGFDARLIKKNVDRLTKLVAGLRVRTAPSAWEGYRSTCSYDETEAAQKDDFVRRVLSRRRRKLTWDLGCNDGRYSYIASRESETTLALDSDPVVVDGLYRALRAEGNDAILPLVVDLANPSPALGWRNVERGTLLRRGSPDLVLCLALVHHLAISRNVPLREVVDWLSSLGGEIVVEFPDRSDPMVQRLLRSKRSDAHPCYSRESFEELLSTRFRVAEALELGSGTRTLYHALPA